MYLNSISHNGYEVQILYAEKVMDKKNGDLLSIYVDGRQIRNNAIVYIDKKPYNAESLYDYLKKNGNHIFNLLNWYRTGYDGNVINTFIVVKACKIDLDFRKIILMDYRYEVLDEHAIDMCNTSVYMQNQSIVPLIDYFDSVSNGRDSIRINLYSSNSVITVTLKDRVKYKELLAKSRMLNRRWVL